VANRGPLCCDVAGCPTVISGCFGAARSPSLKACRGSCRRGNLSGANESTFKVRHPHWTCLTRPRVSQFNCLVRRSANGVTLSSLRFARWVAADYSANSSSNWLINSHIWPLVIKTVIIWAFWADGWSRAANFDFLRRACRFVSPSDSHSATFRKSHWLRLLYLSPGPKVE